MRNFAPENQKSAVMLATPERQLLMTSYISIGVCHT